MSKECSFVEWSKNRLWYYDQPQSGASITAHYRMTIIRLPDNKLFIHSPINITPELQQALAKLGTVAFIIAPNKNHNMYLSDWWLAYPEAYFYAPPDLIHKRQDLTFDNALGTKTPTQWQGQLLQTVIRGSDKMQEIAFYDPQSKTLILGDTLAWMIESYHPLTMSLALINGCYFKPAMPLYWRLTFKNHTQLRQSIQEILTWPFERIILAHGNVIEKDAKTHFANAFQWAMHHKLTTTLSK